MQSIEYIRTDLGGEERVTASLLFFVYDTPNLSVCRVLAPFAVFNLILARGSAGGGMGPGCSWEPFQLDRTEYRELVRAVLETDPTLLEGGPRLASLRLGIDNEFDDMSDFADWAQAVGSKHKESFHEKIRAVEKSGD